MRALTLLLCLLASNAWSADTYINKSCTFNGNGAAGDCAASGGAAGAFNVESSVTYAGVGAGNTLYIARGTTVTFSSISITTAINIDDYGTATDCATWSKTGGSTAMQLTSNGITVRDICVTGSGTSNLVNIPGQNGTLNGVTVHSNTGAGAGISFTATAVNGTLNNVTVHDIQDDGINVNASATGTFTFTNLNCYLIDKADSLGDCVQGNTGTAANIVVDGGTFRKESNHKSAMIYDGSGTFTVKGNPKIYITGTGVQGIAMWGSGAMTLNGVYIESTTGAGNVFVTNTGTTNITGLISKGGDYGVYVSHASGTANLTTASITGAAIAGVYHTTGGTLNIYNTYVDAPTNIYDASAGATTVSDYDRFGPTLGNFRLDGIVKADLSTWQSASSQDANSLAGITPGFVGGTAPTTAAGFCLQPTSSLLAAGTYLGAWILDYNGHGFSNPPNIGAMSLCSDRAPSATRASAATRH